jgi:hypothetical protein
MLLAVATLAAGCSRRPSYGALAGDGYVALATGEQKNIDSRVVRLLPDALSIDSALAMVCLERQKAYDALGDDPNVDSAHAITDRSWVRRTELLTRRSLRISVVPRADGKFAVDSLGAGKYRVWADASVNGERWTWLAPVEVKGGDTAHISLSNDNADEDPFRCQRRDILRDAAKAQAPGP